MRGIFNLGIEPPDLLGETIVTVIVGDTVRIHGGMLMASSPPYYQSNNTPIASLRIIGHNNTPTTLLAQTNQSDTIAYFQAISTRIYKNSSDVIVNADIPVATMEHPTGFNVTGVSPGSSFITYKATAGSITEESELSNVFGKIRVNVIEAPVGGPNEAPDNCNNFTLDIPLYEATTITVDMLTSGYTDPEGDTYSRIRIDSLPVKGLLLVNGVEATIGQILTLEQVGSGALVYLPDPETQNVGDSTEFKWSISDIGSEQFYTNTP